MINVTRIKQIASIYTTIYDKSPDAEELSYYASFNENISLDVISATMMATSPISDDYAQMSTSVLVKSMFQKVFGYTDGEMDELIKGQEQVAKDGGIDGFQYWVDEIDTNPYITEANLAIALLNGGGEEGLKKASNVAEVKASLDEYSSYYGVDLSEDENSSDDSSLVDFIINDGVITNTGSSDIIITDIGYDSEIHISAPGYNYNSEISGTYETGLVNTTNGYTTSSPAFDFPDITIPVDGSYVLNDYLSDDTYLNIDGVSGYIDIEVTLITTVGSFTDESHVTF
ncbi:hypothetical protein ACMC56_11980 [Campylobacterota bacterium DY0563]